MIQNLILKNRYAKFLLNLTRHFIVHLFFENIIMVDWRHGNFKLAFQALFVSIACTSSIAFVTLRTLKSSYQVDTYKDLARVIRADYGINEPQEGDKEQADAFLELLRKESMVKDVVEE